MVFRRFSYRISSSGFNTKFLELISSCIPSTIVDLEYLIVLPVSPPII